jgi:hypothetical protein
VMTVYIILAGQARLHGSGWFLTSHHVRKAFCLIRDVSKTAALGLHLLFSERHAHHKISCALVFVAFGGYGTMFIYDSDSTTSLESCIR